ncbi:MAG: hypothetical protein KGD63_11385 [Candidatus Lokiarchaeota archaeon]|nr:hypothetical protein [Candidatus Lokiarchaeota archaeon]
MRLLRINLKAKKIQYSNIEEDSILYLLGGRGLTSQIIHDEVPYNSDPLGKYNKLQLSYEL